MPCTFASSRRSHPEPGACPWKPSRRPCTEGQIFSPLQSPTSCLAAATESRATKTPPQTRTRKEVVRAASAYRFSGRAHPYPPRKNLRAAIRAALRAKPVLGREMISGFNVPFRVLVAKGIFLNTFSGNEVAILVLHPLALANWGRHYLDSDDHPLADNLAQILFDRLTHEPRYFAAKAFENFHACFEALRRILFQCKLIPSCTRSPALLSAFLPFERPRVRRPFGRQAPKVTFGTADIYFYLVVSRRCPGDFRVQLILPAWISRPAERPAKKDGKSWKQSLPLSRLNRKGRRKRGRRLAKRGTIFFFLFSSFYDSYTQMSFPLFLNYLCIFRQLHCSRLRKLEEEERKYLEEMKRRRERLEGLQSMPISDSKKEEERKCKEEEEKKRKEEEDRKKMEEEKKVS